MFTRRQRVGYGSIAAFTIAAAPPAIGAGLETMGWEWADWTGPWQVAFGVLCVLVGLGCAGYAVGLDRRLTKSKRRSRKLATAGHRPPGLGWEYVSMHEAGVWLYSHGSENLRGVIRRGVPSPFDSIDEHAQALVRNAAVHGAGTLYGRWGQHLPLERIDLASAEYDAFESVLGSDRKLVVDTAILRSDLPRILAYYENGADA